MNLKELWHKYYIDPRKRRLMARYGLPVLKELDRIMRKNAVPYSLVYGSLLGAVREKGFIPHDCDVDIALWADEDYSGVWEDLRAAGFTQKRHILVDDGKFGREETWRYHGIYVDFFFFMPDGHGGYYGTEFYNQPGCRNWTESIRRYGGLQVLKTLLPMAKEVEYVPFESIRMPITRQAMDFVVEYYGPSWRVPDPSFVYPRKGETNYEECPDKLGILTQF